MASRISIARPQSTYQSDPHGLSNSRPSSGYRAADPDDPIEKFKAFTKNVEDNIEIYSQPLKPHLPTIGRFLIVVTFLEDSLRIVTQWSDQVWFLQVYVPNLCILSSSLRRLPDTVISSGESRTCSSCSMLL